MGAAVGAAQDVSSAVISDSELQVLNPVIVSIIVYMMNGFASQKRATEVAGHDQSVLKYEPAHLAHARKWVVVAEADSEVRPKFPFAGAVRPAAIGGG